jgi:hypothetical protein
MYNSHVMNVDPLIESIEPILEIASQATDARSFIRFLPRLSRVTHKIYLEVQRRECLELASTVVKAIKRIEEVMGREGEKFDLSVDDKTYLDGMLTCFRIQRVDLQMLCRGKKLDRPC